MKPLGYLKEQKMEKEVINEASWLPRKTKKWKKRSPIKPLGYPEKHEMEKEVTNETSWLL
jgi:hypothetical protein